MDKNKKTKTLLNKKTLIIIGILVGLPILAFAYLNISSIISFNQLEHDRFKTLDEQVGSIFQDIKAVASGSDEWKYTKDCSEVNNGWGDKSYSCGATISIEKSVTTVGEIAALQAKYYPIIDNSKTLKATSDIYTEPRDFSTRFVSGSVDKFYLESKTNINCTYSAILGQSNETSYNREYGIDIQNNIGRLIIRLDCSDSAHNNWYEPGTYQ